MPLFTAERTVVAVFFSSYMGRRQGGMSNGKVHQICCKLSKQHVLVH